MNKNRIKKLNELYDKIPLINCKGECHVSCTLIPASKIEGKRAKEKLYTNPFKPLVFGKKIVKGEGVPSCKALKDGQCSIYAIRPGICRLYGVTEGMECLFGCKPERILSKQEAYAIIREINEL